jgi:hypothetical protein
MKNVLRRSVPVLIQAAPLVLMLVGVADASSTGTEFQATYDKVAGWGQGYGGKTIVAIGATIGLAFGAVAMNLLKASHGIGLAVVGSLVWPLIDSFYSATI